ncbi:hypothetical protein HYPSUDRAFT_37999 [Hypholoma sublateritium FD-334 SS-4]|uniref:ATP-dependent DNA helicase II subunit 1 n=1 Tax=Hypholoma sublateritium (strain FD-334 SS-4) TaxID=945553 RepID=A0A0D2Q0F6_HYPSF|nr:hypothetical protein HYPSUDRAFT_37999 [Hypholoma sublateritium FD-334 SS-4]
MAPYDDWNKIDDEDDDELQDLSIFESKRDVILFCIDCSESMLKLYDDPKYEESVQTCHLYYALDAAMQLQKKKIIVGPNDAVGIILFNTTRQPDSSTKTQGSEIKRGTYLYQPIGPLCASTTRELVQLLDASFEDQGELRKEFPPLTGKSVPMGDVFTSCNWVLRDGAPKTATKRVFLITDEDNPHAGAGYRQLTTSARTTLIDLTQAGVTVEPFFINTEEKPFDITKFYSSVLVSDDLEDDNEQDDGSILPESISISRIEDLLSQMRIREVPKRSLFSIPFHLANGFTIGIKGYGLITEQKKGSYKYFVDLGDRMEVATVRTTYVDEDRQAEVDKTKIVYGADLGTSATADDDGNVEESSQNFSARGVKAGHRPFYTAEEIRSFRTLGLEPGIKLLGFKDLSELEFEDNIKHSHFIYPDEMSYSGSKRTFSALLKSMIKKKKIGLALVLTRRNATPMFCALLPQEETHDDSGWNDPAGIHLIPLPFADDMRAAPVDMAFKATDEDINAIACEWIGKLAIKNGSYPPDTYPNPALALHNEQLQASAFREEYDRSTFKDLTEPPVEAIHKRAGQLMKEWKRLLANDPSASIVIATTGSKRKADVSVDEAEIKSKHINGTLAKLRVDQLKEFLKSKGQSTLGKKDELLERVSGWLSTR